MTKVSNNLVALLVLLAIIATGVITNIVITYFQDNPIGYTKFSVYCSDNSTQVKCVIQSPHSWSANIDIMGTSICPESPYGDIVQDPNGYTFDTLRVANVENCAIKVFDEANCISLLSTPVKRNIPYSEDAYSVIMDAKCKEKK